MHTPNFFERITYKFQSFRRPSRLDIVNILLHFTFLFALYSHAKGLFSTFDVSKTMIYSDMALSDVDLFHGFHICIYVFYSALYFFQFPFVEQFRITSDPWPWKANK